MSNLEQMIKELCPNGVEFDQLNAVLDYEQPTKYIVKEKSYNNSFKTPVLTAGQSFILGYTNETNSIYHADKENPVIIFDDFTTSFHWVDFDFKIKSSAMKLLKVKHDKIEEVLFRYIYYCMKNINYVPIDHSRQWIGKYSNIEVPLPPLPVQKEIVRILDNYAELTKELTKKLTVEVLARKKQYNYYQDRLLCFETGEFDWKPLGEIGEVRMCKRILKEQTSDTGDVPFYKIGTFGKEANAYISRKLFEEYKSKYSYPKEGEVLISASGTIGRAVIFDGQDSYFQDSNIVWIANEESKVLNKYLFYFYEIAKWEIAEGGTIQRLYNDNLKKTKVPIPYPKNIAKSLKEQQRIVDILDRFDTLCNDISSGLPAEIEARKKQYEYYRNKLLTFPKADIEV